jgi:galactokinase
MEIERIKNAFREIFKSEPVLVRSPGRINIIGEHIDYNGGLVMPAAINKAIYVAISKREDDQIHLYSESYKAFHYSSVNDVQKSDKTWANYVLGVTDQLVKGGHKLTGFNLYLDGDVPLGAGLSSSAALECATVFAIDHITRLKISKMELTLMAQKAEQVFAGVNCGVMDQFASMFGKKDHVIILDCGTMQFEYLPLKLVGYKLVLINSKVKHLLCDSAYNERRSQCEQGLAWVEAHIPEVTLLSDVDLDMLEKFVKPKDLIIYRRCRYVVEEMERLHHAVTKLKTGDLKALGTLLFETHEGLSKEYEVSCKELDFLVNQVKNLDYVLGARMMGGGFGGCTINIVAEDKIETLIDEVRETYLEKFGITLEAYIVETANGTEIIS